MLKHTIYDSPVASINRDENQIFILKLKESNAIYDVDEAINQYQCMNTHSNGNPYKVLIDTRESLVLPTEEACNYYYDGNSFENIVALVVNSLPMQLLLGRMFRHETVPNSRIFKNDLDGYDWLIKQDFGNITSLKP